MTPNQLTLTELTSLLNEGKISSRELTQACLDRITAVDDRVHAYLSLDPEDALRQADEADRARSRDGAGPDRPLLGIPISLKDNLAVRDQPLGCASKILEGFVSPYDATVVERLKAAGAVVFGRLNLDEFAMGSSTENSAFGATRNPWALDCVPGGSSGGAAAAVAAGECIAAVGSDTGGSIRQPASLTGCVGLKPTYGRVSRFGLVAFASSLDQIGPLTRSVRDSAALLEVLAGVDARDSTSVQQPVPGYIGALTGDLRGLKLGRPREYYVEGLHPGVRRAVDTAVERMAALGAEILDISLPHTEYAVATYYIIATAEASANLARFDGIRYGKRVEGNDPATLYSRTRGAGFGAEVKRRIILGTYALSSGYYDAYYLRAQKVRALIRRDFERAFERVDAIVTPTTPTPAFKAGEKTRDPLQMYLSDIFTISANLAGNCGISVPCGFTDDPRLPVGLQVLGPAFGEETVLRVAHAFEQSTRWHVEAPGL